METIDRWLKSLRLHKYTPLFKRLTYNEMLNLDEKFLVERDITKGARNKILVSVKRLNLRQDQLANMMDDLDQDNISMKEALNVLKEMLITPIPYPPSEQPQLITPPTPPSTTRSASSTGDGTDTDDHSSTTSNSCSSSSSSSSSVGSTSAMSTTSTGEESPSLYSSSALQTTQNIDKINCTTSFLSTSTPSSTPSTNNNNNNYHSDPHELTHLYVDTFSKVAQRLIESVAGSEDSACHGILAAIVDECLNHNSFTKGQKAIVARYRQHQITKEQKPRAVGYMHYKHQLLLQQQQQQQQLLQHQQLSLRQYYQNQLQHHQVQHQRAVNIHSYGNSGTNRHYQQQQQQQQQHHQQTSYTHNPHSNQFHHHHHQQVNHLPPYHQIILPNHLSALRNKQQQQQQQQQLQKQQQEHQHQQHHYQQPSQRNNHKTAGGVGCGVGGGGGGGSTNGVVVDHWNGPYNRKQFSVSPSSLSISTMGSLSTASNSDEEERTPLSDSYREYSLLGPGLTFELPFLRAKVAAATSTTASASATTLAAATSVQ